MPANPKSRNWSDVQTAIATVAIVSTIGLWNLFATPSKVKAVQSQASPPEVPPTEVPVETVPTAMPQVKIIFTQAAPQTTVMQQVQPVQQTVKKKKNRNNTTNNTTTNNNNNGGNNAGTVSVTQTKTS